MKRGMQHSGMFSSKLRKSKCACIRIVVGALGLTSAGILLSFCSGILLPVNIQLNAHLIFSLQSFRYSFLVLEKIFHWFSSVSSILLWIWLKWEQKF